jgi:hypothetical protein
MAAAPRNLMSWRSLVVAVAMLFGAVEHGAAAIAARSNVQIVNVGNATLSYDLRPIGGAWTNHSIAAGGTASFDCSDCSGFEMRVATGSNAGAVHSLASGTTYQIFWNASAKIWDVSVAQRR